MKLDQKIRLPFSLKPASEVRETKNISKQLITLTRIYYVVGLLYGLLAPYAYILTKKYDFGGIAIGTISIIYAGIFMWIFQTYRQYFRFISSKVILKISLFIWLIIFLLSNIFIIISPLEINSFYLIIGLLIFSAIGETIIRAIEPKRI